MFKAGDAGVPRLPLLGTADSRSRCSARSHAVTRARKATSTSSSTFNPTARCLTFFIFRTSYRRSSAVQSTSYPRAQRQDAEVVANEVARNLQRIPLEALAARAGRRRGGYVHETDAAWALLEETVQPYVDDLQRRARLGLTDAAGQLAQGLVAGLYRCRDAQDSTVLGYAGEDAAEQLAEWAVREAVAAGLHLQPGNLVEAAGDWSLDEMVI